MLVGVISEAKPKKKVNFRDQARLRKAESHFKQSGSAFVFLVYLSEGKVPLQKEKFGKKLAFCRTIT